jgi:chorismate mutase
MVRGIRGAVAAEANTAEAILEATRLLLEQMTVENNVVLTDIAAVHFSATPDLNAAFPARAARQMGWDSVPLFGHLEMAVPGAVVRCIRVLMLVNTEMAQDQLTHIYLGETRRLREL